MKMILTRPLVQVQNYVLLLSRPTRSEVDLCDEVPRNPANLANSMFLSDCLKFVTRANLRSLQVGPQLCFSC